MGDFAESELLDSKLCTFEEVRGKSVELNLLDKCHFTHEAEDIGLWYVRRVNKEDVWVTQENNGMLVQRDDPRFRVEVVKENSA